MSDESNRELDSRRAARPSGVIAAVIVAVGVIVVLSTVLVAFYSSYLADTNARRLVAVESQLRDLASNQELIAAQLKATATAPAPSASRATSGAASSSRAASGSTVPAAIPVPVAPASSGQPKLTAQQQALGIRLVLGKVVKRKGNNAQGLAISFKPGGYYEGSVGFSVAASRGDVMKGAYYVDDSTTRTIDATILSGADVSVYGWSGTAADKQSSIGTAELEKELVGGASPTEPWKDAWYWLEIGPGMAIVKLMQLPPA